MARIYELLQYVVGHTAGELAVINFPSRTTISRVTAVGPTSYNLTAYSRNIDPPAIDIASIRSDPGGKVLIIPNGAVKTYLRTGDTVTVAGTTVAGYHTTHVVTAIHADGIAITTDQTYTADAEGGTATLTLSTAEKSMFEIIPQTAAASGLAEADITKDIAFVNEDTEFEIHKWTQGKLYFLLSTSGNYRILVTGATDIS